MRHVSLWMAGALVVWLPSGVFAQGLVATSPPANISLKAADDFFTTAFQNPVDFNQKTDVGPFLGSKDGASNWSQFSFQNGMFTGVTSASDAQLWLLDTGNPLAAPLGRTGTNFPIDANYYTVLSVRMNATLPSPGADIHPFVHSWPNTIFDSAVATEVGGALQAGWNLVTMDLQALNNQWSATRRALRFDPEEGATGVTVIVDHARLTHVDPALCQTINWTGGNGTADIYLDNDTDPANGFIGLLQRGAKNTPTAGGVQSMGGCPVPGSGGFGFNTGTLPAGTYTVFVAQPNALPATFTAATVSYAPGAYAINETPVLTFLSPNPEGSSDDFFATQFNDPVDFDKLADVDSTVNVVNPSIQFVNGEDPAGAPLISQRVFSGANPSGGQDCTNPGDPQMQLLSSTKRGQIAQIDPTRYRLLTVVMGFPDRPRDVNCGGIARVIWKQQGQPTGFVSDDIIINSRGGTTLFDAITLDMATLNVEPNQGPHWVKGPGGTGMDIFRFDPSEFTPSAPFVVNRISLRAMETANQHYLVQWNVSTAGGTVDLYYDTDKAGFDGTLIAQSLSAAAGQYDWQIPTNLPTSPGTPYYIYAVFSNGTDAACAGAGNAFCNSNRVYAAWPVIMDSTFQERPRLVLNRQVLNFAAQANTTTGTDPQTVRLTFVGAGATPCWTIASSSSNFTVTPSSGTGNQTVTVAVVPQTFPAGASAVITFTVNNGSCGNTMMNPGQHFIANYNVKSAPTAPIGTVDTPAPNSTVVGSMGITGWVVDDIGVTFVKIYRQAIAGETGDGLGRVFIGDANLVEGARPDIEAANPTTPFNYRAGWGYLVLTNFLPNQGNGTFVFQAYAYDKDGHEAFLGQRTVIAANGTSTFPFGAIDTPGQGATVTGASVANFGWVLTKGPNHADPPGGGAVSVVWDGAFIGSPGQWTSRSDLSALFPAAVYPGINFALGVYLLDSTVYTDGVHTLSWVVVASNGQATGIGSRYVTTVNGNSLTLTDSVANGDLGRKAHQVATLDRLTTVRAANGYAAGPASLVVAPDPTGLRTVYGRSLERLVVDASRPGARRYEAYESVGGTLRALPAGASFDERRGILYWQPGVGFAGSYDLVIVRDGRERVPVRVVLSGTAPRIVADRSTRGVRHFLAGCVLNCHF